jgi:hypothetical protein
MELTLRVEAHLALNCGFSVIVAIAMTGVVSRSRGIILTNFMIMNG